MNRPARLSEILRLAVMSAALLITTAVGTGAQNSPKTSPDTTSSRAQAESVPEAAAKNPAQIELLETHIRLEADGSSRKEVHARVRIHSELGARQFARLNFEYHRAFETVEVPLARITHAGGGTSDILPSAISDQPNPAVAAAPAYQDIRRKTVRILGLQPSDILEYRIITVANRAPLAPDFFLFHSFAKDNIVTREVFELDLPASRKLQLRVNPATPETYAGQSGDGSEARSIHRWERSEEEKSPPAPKSVKPGEEKLPGGTDFADVSLSTFSSWEQLSARLAEAYQALPQDAPEIMEKVVQLTAGTARPEEKIQNLYDFVAQKIATVDLPLGSNGFRTRAPGETLASGYATPEDKAALLTTLILAAKLPAAIALAGAPVDSETQLPRPSLFTHLLIWTGQNGPGFWLDPTVEVAPFRMIAANLRGSRALLLLPAGGKNASLPRWLTVPVDLPFPATQKVNVAATLADDGQLTAKVHYALRGDNELLLRVAFHQTPPDKWKDLTQLLAIADGFRGQIITAAASDPLSTREPFTVDYEILTPKFVDWKKKPVRIPALLPQVGLPDPAAKSGTNQATAAIELGTPLDVETTATLYLPEGTTARMPTGTSVERDYAVFSSKYSMVDANRPARSVTLTATRHIRFLLREIPAARLADYRAFMHAVQNDEAQDFTLERTAAPATKSESSATQLFVPAKP